MGKYIDLSKLDREQLKQLHIFMIQNDIKFDLDSEFIIDYESQPYYFAYSKTWKRWGEYVECHSLEEITLQQFFKLGKYD